MDLKNNTVEQREYLERNLEQLICKGPNDVCRIYYVKNWGFELRYNSLWYGDPVYTYKTLKGAKIAMARMSKGIYKNLKKPSTAWE